jgi:nicotinamide-nucleotide amidase
MTDVLTYDLAKQVLELARERGLMIATAESCTGGMVAASLTDIVGSSDVFDRGFVTYSNDAKQEMIGVSPQTLADFGAVSTQTALEMASGAVVNSRARLTVSITGIAGPGGTGTKPEGLVCFATCLAGQAPKAEQVTFGAIGRANVRQASVQHALAMLIKELLNFKMP